MRACSSAAFKPWVRALFLLRESIVAPARATTGQVSVKTLSEQAKVTPQNVRKGQNELMDVRMLTRATGGTILSSRTENVVYAARPVLVATDRKCLAAASLVPANTRHFINSGTTTEEFAFTWHENLD